MDVTLEQPRASRPLPQAALGKLTAATLIGLGVLLTLLQAAVFGFDTFIMGITVVAIIVAVVVLRGGRWTPALGALVAGALGVLVAMPAQEVLTTPSISGPMFGLLALALTLAVVGFGSGIAATVQNYHQNADARRMPRGLVVGLVLLAGLLAGATSVALVPLPGIIAGISPNDLARLPALNAQKYQFDQSELHAKVGQPVTLRLTNSDPEAHYLDIDELNVHAPIAVGQTSITIFTPTASGSYTFYCHPHADKASGQGMVGKLIVTQ